MTLNDIVGAVLDRLDTGVDLLPIKYDSAAFEHNGSPYVEMIVSPRDTQIETVDNGDLMSGFLVFNVYMPKQSGTFAAFAQGQKFIDLFHRGLQFGGVEITKTGTINNPVHEESWDFTPVVIEYEARSCAIP